ncbi:glucosamine-6-phosphate deaminase [Malacoplasma muris]|uniref:glucosamine-6-phosphate deaminase n=1 Tax=Malacoplasma muris TaxID=2119 RepID=UPI00398EDFA3
MEQNFIKPKFLVFPTKDNANKYVSDLIVKAVANNPNLILGLPTGVTPLIIYKNLIDANKANVISFANVSTFNMDEFIGIEDKNYEFSRHNYMDQNLFDHIDINKDNTFFPIPFGFDFNANPNYDYVDYDRFIESKGYIDLLLMGVGNNGELAFNQPNVSSFEDFTSVVQLSEPTMNSLSKTFGHRSLVPNYAVTMGIQSILYSKKIVLVAYGVEKAEALYNLFFNNEFDENWPITSLNYHTDVIVVCDKEAATYIMERKIQ